jgi:hypothetical protein
VDDKQAQSPDVERTLYTTKDEAWKEYEATANAPYPTQVVYPPPRGTLMQAFQLRDVYIPHRPSSVAHLELVSAQIAHSLIDALDDTLLAFPMGDMCTHFTVRGFGPLTASNLITYRQLASYSFVGA